MSDTLTTEMHQTRVEVSAMRRSLDELARSVSQLATATARYEERHASLDEMARRIGKQTDALDSRVREFEKVFNPEKVAGNETAIRDLDVRVESLEAVRLQAAGGWKTIGIAAAGFMSAATLAVAVYAALN